MLVELERELSSETEEAQEIETPEKRAERLESLANLALNLISQCKDFFEQQFGSLEQAQEFLTGREHKNTKGEQLEELRHYYYLLGSFNSLEKSIMVIHLILKGKLKTMPAMMPPDTLIPEIKKSIEYSIEYINQAKPKHL